MPDDPDVDPRAADGTGFGLALIALHEGVGAALVSAAAGYRRSLVEAGVSETAADLMAVDYHREVLVPIVSKARPTPPESVLEG